MWAKQAIGLVEGIGQSARARHAAELTSNMAVDFPTLETSVKRSVPICEVPDCHTPATGAFRSSAFAPS